MSQTDPKVKTNVRPRNGVKLCPIVLRGVGSDSSQAEWAEPRKSFCPDMGLERRPVWAGKTFHEIFMNRGIVDLMGDALIVETDEAAEG